MKVLEPYDINSAISTRKKSDMVETTCEQL